jgi:hypothetical protein
MAAQWGNNSLGPGQSHGWYFIRPVTKGVLVDLSVIPLSPSFTNSNWSYQGFYAIWNQLGHSPIFSQLSNDQSNIAYFMVVQNFSNNTMSYAFLETDL